MKTLNEDIKELVNCIVKSYVFMVKNENDQNILNGDLFFEFINAKTSFINKIINSTNDQMPYESTPIFDSSIFLLDKMGFFDGVKSKAIITFISNIKNDNTISDKDVFINLSDEILHPYLDNMAIDKIPRKLISYLDKNIIFAVNFNEFKNSYKNVHDVKCAKDLFELLSGTPVLFFDHPSHFVISQNLNDNCPSVNEAIGLYENLFIKAPNSEEKIISVIEELKRAKSGAFVVEQIKELRSQYTSSELRTTIKNKT